MANEWGDSPVSAATTENDWGDAPVAVSPYTTFLQEDAARQRRIAQNTPEFIAQQAVSELTPEQIAWKTRVPVGMGVSLPQPVAQGLLENAPRVMAPIGAGLSLTGVGTVPGLAIMGAAGLAGEVGSQVIENELTGSRQSYSPAQMAVGGALSAVPAARLTGIASPLARGALRVGEGAAIGGAAPLLEAGFEGRLPTAEDFQRAKMGAAFGAVLGTPFGAMEFLPRGAARAASPAVEIIDPIARPQMDPAVLPQISRQQRQAELESVFNLQRPTEIPEPGFRLPEIAPVDDAVLRRAALAQQQLEGAPIQAGAAQQSAEAILEAERLAERQSQIEARTPTVRSRINALVEEISGGDPIVRAQIIGRGRRLGDEQFLQVLQNQSSFARNPAAQPDILAAEIASARHAEIAARARANAAGVAPQELEAIAGAQAATELENIGLNMVGGTPEELRLRRLAERMAGKTPDQQLAVLDQEVKLAGDTLTPTEQRGALDLKQQLQAQVQQQKAEQAAAKAAAPAPAPAAPEIPKSAQILAEPATKAPSIANVATEIATQTENSPFALQAKLNAVTEAPVPAAVAPEVPIAPNDMVTVYRGEPTVYAKNDDPNSGGWFTTDRTLAESAAQMRANTSEGRKASVYSVEIPRPEFEQYQKAAVEANGPGEYGWNGEVLIPEKYRKQRKMIGEVLGGGTERPKAPATFIGTQEGFGDIPATDLFNLTADIPGHPTGSTVSRETLEKAGFEVPAKPKGLPKSERGAISPAAISSIGGANVGGAIGFTQTEREEDETEQEFQARRLRNTLIGAGAGAAGGLALAKGSAKASQKVGASMSAKQKALAKKDYVPVPDAPDGMKIRRTPERIIENPEFSPELRERMAANPEIFYDPISMREIEDKLNASSAAQLNELRMGEDANLRAAATYELANRLSVEGRHDEAEKLYMSIKMTSPAQMLNMAKFIKSPTAYVGKIKNELKQVKKTLSTADADALKALKSKQIKAEQDVAAAQRKLDAEFSPANIQARDDAQTVASASQKALDEFLYKRVPESWADIVSKLIQLNLLSPLSLAKNVWGNGGLQAMNRTRDSISSALDAIYTPTANAIDRLRGLPGERSRTIMLGNPLPSKAELSEFVRGAKVASKELISGPSPESYAKSEVQRGFKPLDAAMQFFTNKDFAQNDSWAGALNDRLKKLVEALPPSMHAEAMARGLNLGDKPIRRMVEQRELENIARIRGLKGDELKRFMSAPPRDVREQVLLEGQKATLSQKNDAANKISYVLDEWLADLIAGGSPTAKGLNKIAGRVVAAYRNFPLNFVNSAVNYALPSVAVLRSYAAAQRGDRRAALTALSEGMIGATVTAAGIYLYNKGLISEPASKDAKKRSAQYEQMGPGRINVSGIERLRNGGDPTWRRGDDTREWNAIGPAAAPLFIATERLSKMSTKAARLGIDEAERDSLDFLDAVPGMLGYASEQSFLSGTSAAIEAIQDWDNKGDKFLQNSFRALSSTVAPASLEALARAEGEAIPELKGRDLGETMENTLRYKTMMLPEGGPSKRDVFGAPIPRNPEGKNPYVNQFLDVTRSETKPMDDFRQALSDIYKQTKSGDVYPTPPAERMEQNGVTVKLDPVDLDLLREFVGKERQDSAQRLMDSQGWNTLTPEQKIIQLNKAYSQAAEYVNKVFMRNPTFRDKYFRELDMIPPKEGDESRVVSRSAEARDRLNYIRQQQR